MSPPDDVILKRFSAQDPVLAAETGIASVWKVTRPDGNFALKIYNNGDLKNEGPGFDLLRDLDGRGATKIIDQQDAAVLMEWLDGPSLGDLVRDGQDELATKLLVRVALDVHARPAPTRHNYPTLDQWFQALMSLTYATDCPTSLCQSFDLAKSTARQLLASQTAIRPLHGDLHHDNIKQGDRGWLAFDAKGVIGERTFELANAMRNPKGAEALMRNPQRITRLRDSWSAAFGVCPKRLMQWVVAKSALSIAWSCQGTLSRCDGDDLVQIFADLLAD